jgi:hypothetical protein
VRRSPSWTAFCARSAITPVTRAPQAACALQPGHKHGAPVDMLEDEESVREALQGGMLAVEQRVCRCRRHRGVHSGNFSKLLDRASPAHPGSDPRKHVQSY